jgi:3-methyladenine DNA glycosylase AlkD
MVVEAEIFPAAFACLNDSDEYVKKNCATLIREIVKHTPEVKFILFYLFILILNLVSTNDC